MDDIIKELRSAYLRRGGLKARLIEINARLEFVETSLTPLDGWEGKNAEARDLMRRRALKSDSEWARLNQEKISTLVALESVEARIEALEAQRRAMEFAQRQQLIDVLRALLPMRDDTDVVRSLTDALADAQLQSVPSMLDIGVELGGVIKKNEEELP